jgi:hypothetical protein
MATASAFTSRFLRRIFDRKYLQPRRRFEPARREDPRTPLPTCFFPPHFVLHPILLATRHMRRKLGSK